MKKKIIHDKIFIILLLTSIFFNILTFTKMNNDYFYALKFIFPVIQVIYLALRYGINVEINKNTWIVFSLLTVVFLGGFLSTKNIINTTLEYISVVFLLYNCLILLPNLLKSDEDKKSLYNLIYIGYVVSFVLILVYNMLVIKDYYYVSGTRVRYTLAFSNANSLAMFSLFGFIMGIFRIKIMRRKKFLLPMFFFFLVILSDSRTSLFTGIISIFLFLNLNWTSYIFKVKKSIMAIILLALIISGFLTFQYIGFDTIDIFLSGRLSEITNSFNSFKPIQYLFGMGFGEIEGNPHNGYLTMLFQTGIFGFVISYGLIFQNLFSEKKYQKGDGQELRLSYKIIILIFLIFGIGESLILSQGNFNTVLLWVSIGFLINNINSQLK